MQIIWSGGIPNRSIQALAKRKKTIYIADQKDFVKFPLFLSFRPFSPTSNLILEDSNGSPVAFVKQKMHKLPERISVHSDETRWIKLVDMKRKEGSDGTIRYLISNPSQQCLGSIESPSFGVKNPASKLIHYTVSDETGSAVFAIQLKNPMARTIDRYLGKLPFVCAAINLAFRLSHVASRAGGEDAVRLRKRVHLFGGRFAIELLSDDLSEEEQKLLIYAFIVVKVLG